MHNRMTLLLCAAFLAVPALAMEPLRIRPVAPSTTDAFTLRIIAPGCTAGFPIVTSSLLPPRIDVRLTAGACPNFPTQPPLTGPTLFFLPFAARPAGDYHVTVRLQDGVHETVLSEGRLVVHEDVPDVEVHPWVVAASGGTELHVRGHLPLCLQSGCPETGPVTIDGQPFTAHYAPDELIVDAAPPHAEGAVDIGIRYNGKELRSNALLYYYDPQSEPEWSVFEPVLLPVLDGGPGVLGSLWETEAIVAGQPSYLVAASAPPGENDTAGFRRFSGRGFPHGAIFAIPRRESALTHFALRLREVSKSADGYGTELPIVHEKDFLSPRLSLYDVPAGPRFRSKLRVYSINPPDGDEGQVSVTVTRSGTNRYLTTEGVRWTRPRCSYESCMPAYADIDLDSLSWIPEIRAGGRIDLSLWTSYADVWAFVTVVDNATQSVSVISPR
jgi:hypothetical protein